MKRSILALTVGTLFVIAVASAAAQTVEVVKGNTVDTTAGENGSTGWWFGRDPGNQTPYEFTTDQARIGQGSLYVEPISDTAASNKFIGELFLLGAPIDENTLFSLDFLMGDGGGPNAYKQFYINVYANLPGTTATNYYQCRFDYVATSGSTTTWTTVSTAGAATAVAKRNNPAWGGACPASLTGMPEGSTIRAISVNVGDTSINDAGVSGYLDNVVATVDGATTVYDFEPTITVANKEACKNGGWQTSNTPVYTNQGDCVSAFASGGKAGGNK